ncbi:MAG: 50S ribosomal protein L30 [bacterium]
MASKKAKKRSNGIENLVRRMNEKDASAERIWRVTLSGSEIGGTQEQRATLRCLGLRRRGSTAMVKDSAPARGRIRAMAHLLLVEEV